MKNFAKLLLLVFGCEFVGLIATPVTITSIPTWYVHLNKPFFSPPNFIFGPVWTILYCLMGVSLYLVLQKGMEKKTVQTAVYFFVTQLFFNFLWSLIFFGLHQPLFALVDIIAMLMTIILAMLNFKKLSQTAFYLLVPYLLWVSFATLLNASVVLLNP